MIITCAQCSVSFNLNEDLLKPTGSKVRCSKCKTIFTAFPSKPEPEPEIELEIEPEIKQEELETAVEEPPVQDKDNDFSELEQMLEEDDDDPEEPESGEIIIKEVEVDTEEEEFDLSEIEDVLDFEEPSDDDEEPPNVTLELAPDELSVDDIEADDIEENGFDLSDTEESTEEEAENLELDIDGDFSDEDLELDLDLELDEDVSAGDTEEEVSEELELEADEDIGEDFELDLEADEDIGEDLDLELDLEADDDDGDLELDLDEGLSESGTDELSGGGEEIDLSELEQTLEMELLSEDDGDEDEPINEDLALADDEMLEEETDFEDEGDVDDSDIEKLLEMDEEELPLEEDSEMRSDELELEFDLSEEDQEAEKKEEAAEVEAKDDATDKKQEKKPAEEKSKEKPTLVKKKRKISLPVLILMILVILTGSAVGGLFLLKSQGIEIPHMDKLKNIPYLGDLLTPKETGAIDAIQSSITSDFVNNQSAGKLFIITGKVENTTSYTHHSVEVTAKLYTKGKKLVKSKVTYCGKLISKDELFTSTLDIITKRLSSKTTETGQMISLKPGASLPFMVVIPNLPDNLEEYEVRVSGSTPVKNVKK